MDWGVVGRAALATAVALLVAVAFANVALAVVPRRATTVTFVLRIGALVASLPVGAFVADALLSRLDVV